MTQKVTHLNDSACKEFVALTPGQTSLATGRLYASTEPSVPSVLTQISELLVESPLLSKSPMSGDLSVGTDNTLRQTVSENINLLQ